MVSDEQTTDEIQAVDAEIENCIAAMQDKCGSQCFPILLGGNSISVSVVDDVYDELTARFGTDPLDAELAVVLESPGGNIDAAYNIAHLLRRYGGKKLTFVIPRWAKSAATLLACSGDEILMTPVAELGPLDPQITTINTLEGRIEQFSPLDIESTLELIRNEYHNGHNELAYSLVERLQFPLTLGSFKKSLELSKQCLENLLTSRMMKGDAGKSKEIAERLVEGYAAHGFCINIDEARSIGLIANEVPSSYLSNVWEIHKLALKKQQLRESQLAESALDPMLPESNGGGGPSGE